MIACVPAPKAVDAVEDAPTVIFCTLPRRHGAAVAANDMSIPLEKTVKQ
jgi:hypothetical protein